MSEQEPLAWALSRAGELHAALATEAASHEESERLGVVLSAVKRFGRSLDAFAIDREARLPREALREAAHMGLFALTIPERHGGLGLSLKGACRAVDALARHERGIAITVGLHNGLGTQGLCFFGSEAQRQRYLPELASGERIASFAATEPGAGSDLLAITTTARQTEGGYLVSGEKSYVTNGGFAGLYTLLVRTPHLGRAAQSLMCIEAGAPGLAVGAEEDKLGIRGSSTVSLHLDDVYVPAGQVLGEPGRGSEYAHALLAWGRTLMSGGCIGIAHAAVDAAASHVRARKQFGKHLSQQPLVQQHLADMAARVYAMEALVRLTGAAQQGRAGIDLLSAFAKVFCSEGAFDVSDQCLQLHGALGFLEPTGVARLLRDCRITRIFEGANDVLLVRTAASLLAGVAASAGAPLSPQVAPELAGTARAFDELVDRLDARTAQLRKQHGVALVRKQALLAALARARVSLTAALASLLRGTGETGQEARSLAEHAACGLLADATAQLHILEGEEHAARQERARGIAEQLCQEAPR